LSLPDDPIRQLYAGRASITIWALIIAAVLTEVGMEFWPRVLVLAYVLLLGLIADFWRYSHRLRSGLAKKKLERSDAVARAGDEQQRANELETRLQTVESQALAFEEERNELQRELRRPRRSLEEVLGAVDRTNELVTLVAKHRKLGDAGFARWPVTEIALREEGDVAITASGDEARRVTDEEMTLASPEGEFLVFGTVAATGPRSLRLLTEVDSFPTPWRDELLSRSQLPPQGFSLRLLGLTIPGYAGVGDSHLKAIGTAIAAASRAITKGISGTFSEPGGGQADDHRTSHTHH
jgi:hypothetical protein